MENLLTYVTTLCDNYCSGEEYNKPCINCEYPKKACTGDCNDCLNEVHFKDYYPAGKKDYDCVRMVCYYACRYCYKYCSEIESALNNIDSLSQFKKFNVLSLGCGCSPDLMAFDSYRKLNSIDIPINYLGIEANNIWSFINKQASSYRKNNSIVARYVYGDVIEYLSKTKLRGVNVIVIQYLISHLLATDQEIKINLLYDRLIRSVINDQNDNLIIIVNDINRDLFRRYIEIFLDKLNEAECTFNYTRRYFKFKPYGKVYLNSKSLHDIPVEIINKYKTSKNCSSMQLIIEI